MEKYRITIQNDGHSDGGLLTTPTMTPVKFEYADLDAGQKAIYDAFVKMVGAL